ncbi:sensor histidine kinase [Streptomyces europaeiscabiei]|uniref:hypothetical protein n=1 Tax=Streptomyces europaeiscabiei TaxID=146819 RepID=UPI0038F6E22E
MVAYHDRLDPALDAVLAIVQREGTTNILKHSQARKCHVTLTVSSATARLVMVNDDVVPSAAGLPGGHGLADLGARLAEFGGRREAGVREDGRFHLVAEAPLPPSNDQAAAVQTTGVRESAPAWGRSARNESKRSCAPESCSPRISIWSAERWPLCWSWKRI